MGEVICCSKNTLLVSSCLWFLISAGATGFLLFAFVGGTGIYLVPPELAYIALISLFGLFFIVSGSALLARLCHNEILLTFSIVMTFITILVTIFGGVFILLYANDISSVSALDDAAFTAQENAENAFFEWATDPNNAADWVSSQNDLKCCGYDAEQLFKDTKDALFTGELCSSTDVNILNISESVCPGGEFTEETCEETLKTTLGVDNNPTFFCKDAIIVFFQDQTMFIGIGFGALVLIQLVAWFAAMRMYWVPFGRGGFMGDDSYDSGLPTKSTGPSASGMDLAAPGPNSFGGGGAGGPGPGGMQTSAFGQRVRNFGNRMSTRMSTRPGGGGGGFGAPSSGFGAPSQGFGGGGAGAGGPPPGGPPPGGFGGGFGGAVKAFGNRVSARFAGKPSFGQARPPPGPPGGAPPSFGGPNAPKFGGSSPGGMGGGSSRGGGGGFGDLPPPNNFGSGGGSGQQAVGGGGFGSKLKGGFSRVSARIQGGFGGFGRNARPPPGPPPGMGGGNSPPGGSRFGVGAPPPSFGGGPPPRGPPSFGGGGGAGGPPQRSAPPQQRAAPRAAPAKKGGFGFGRSGGGSRGGAPAARPPNPMGGGGRGGLLAQIQQGKNLNRTHTNDRSAPQV